MQLQRALHKQKIDKNEKGYQFIGVCSDVIQLCYLNCTHIILAPCLAGHQPNADGNGCMECPLDTYKTDDDATTDWRSPCKSCTDDKETVDTGSTDPDTQCIGKSQVSIQRGEITFHTFNQSMHFSKPIMILKSV